MKKKNKDDNILDIDDDEILETSSDLLDENEIEIQFGHTLDKMMPANTPLKETSSKINLNLDDSLFDMSAPKSVENESDAEESRSIELEDLSVEAPPAFEIDNIAKSREAQLNDEFEANPPPFDAIEDVNDLNDSIVDDSSFYKERDTKDTRYDQDDSIYADESKPTSRAEDIAKESTQRIDISEPVSMTDEYSPSEFHSPSFGTQDNQLARSESLSVAQQKIHDLEKDNERLRSENEELASAAETFRNKADNLEQRTALAEGKYSDLRENVESEKRILLDSISEKDRENDGLKQKILELETRLQTGVKKIRVRERELENRLELIKMEGKALLQNKDEMILNLKRQIDQISMELESARNRFQESIKVLSQKQGVLRRTVKTLRLALSLLETEEVQAPGKIKKVD